MSTSTLGHTVFISDPILQGLPLASTLVFGERDAVLVDVPITEAQAEHLAGRIAATGKRLTHVFITHGHGDHWLGLSTVLRHFPDAEVVATAATVAMMAVHGSPQMRAEVWEPMFPGQIGDAPVLPQAWPAQSIDLEGHELRIVGVGHTDTDDTSVLHVPSLALVVAGDAVYNGVHQYLVESAGGGRAAWLAGIDVVEALEPRTVVAGHKDPDRDDEAARVLAETRDYLRSAEDVLAQQQEPGGFVEAMTARYPERLNPAAVQMSASALYQ